MLVSMFQRASRGRNNTRSLPEQSDPRRASCCRRAIHNPGKASGEAEVGAQTARQAAPLGSTIGCSIPRLFPHSPHSTGGVWASQCVARQCASSNRSRERNHTTVGQPVAPHAEPSAPACSSHPWELPFRGELWADTVPDGLNLEQCLFASLLDENTLRLDFAWKMETF